MIQRLAATQFHRFMGSGRTQPALCGCEGGGGQQGEFVVKLRGCMEHGAAGLAFELIASQLAAHFGIATPAPAIIALDEPMARLMARLAARPNCVLSSVGDNFGSGEIRGASTMPVDGSVSMLDAAARIVAFDALIQNPDRRYNNPNLLLRGHEIFAVDHELAFSFVFAIAPPQEPWKLGAPYPFEQHPLFRAVKGKSIDLQGFRSALAGLSPQIVAAMLSTLPQEWENQHMAPIARYLAGMSAHAKEFTDGICRRLV